MWVTFVYTGMKLSARQVSWISWPLALSLRALGRSWRVRKQGLPAPHPDPQFIEAFCHGDMLFFMLINRDSPCVTMISEHRDGELVAQVVERLGGSVSRGSSTRGGAKAYLNMMKNHQDIGWIVTPDGPRGPRGSVQGGVIQMAADAGRAIRPHGYAAAGAKKLGTWDGFRVPYPFTRIVEFTGDPIHVPPDINREGRAEFAKELERSLAEASQKAEQALDRWLQRPEPSRMDIEKGRGTTS